MSKKRSIPVHRMDDWFSGIYIKPIATGAPLSHTYEIAMAHRHDFYYAVLLEQGKMEMEVDFEPVLLCSPALFFSYPGQIHRIASNQMKRGWFLAFDPALLVEKLKSLLDQRLPEILLVPLSAAQSADLPAFLSNLYALYNDQTQLFRQPLVQSLINAFGYQVASAYLAVETSGQASHADRCITITKDFKRLLRHHFKTIKKPSAYAEKMNLTTSYLNDCVREITGFATGWFIQQETIREARRLLYYSDLSVKEIAAALGYEDAKYFSRLFTKITATSPAAFRKQMLSV